MKGLSLRVRVFALVSILVLSSILVLTCFLLKDVGDRLHENFEARGSIIVNYFARNSVEGIIIEDEDSLTDTVKRLFEIDDIVYAHIYDREGTRIVSQATVPVDDETVTRNADAPKTVRITRIPAHDEIPFPILDFKAPTVDENNAYIGCVQVGISLDNIGRDVQKMATRAVLLLCVFICIGAVASFLVARSIVNPIQSLTRVFTVIANGDLDHPIDTSRRDELGSLSKNFAAMRDSIRNKLELLEAEARVRIRAEEELKQHRDHLEQRVRERTARLEREIAERKQTEEKLRESKQRLALHVEQTPLAVIEWNCDFKVVEWNPGAERIFGYARAEALGQHAQFIIPNGSKADIDKVWQALLDKRGGTNSTNSNTTKDGEIIFCEWYNTPLIDPEGHVIGVTSLALDITERQQAEEELERSREDLARSVKELESANHHLEEQTELANRLAEEAERANAEKSNFLSNMSHEIRTPMNAIIGFSDMLAEEDLTSEQLQHVNILRDSSKSLLSLINDILDFSKIEAGKLTIDTLDCSLDQILHTVEAMMRPLARKKGIELAIIEESPLPTMIHADPVRLNQCLINLINNAIKFTHQGHVHVKIFGNLPDRKNHLRFDVEDTGIGIPADKQTSIFKSFTQADSSTSRKYGGTGLGLAITKQLAGLLGGELSVTSEVGKGSTFSLTIPVGANLTLPSELDQDPATDLGNKEPKTRQTLSFSGKVLVAEDVEPSQILMRSLLTKMGLHVTVVGNGKQVLEKVSSESFDLILMDIQMPEMNGYEATMALRRQGHRTPIVALTANAMRGDNQKCLDAGCDDYLTKPINRLEFQRKLAQYLPSTQAASKTTADSSPTRTHTPLALGGDGVVPEPNAEIQHNKCIINWPQLLDRWGDEAFIRDAIPAYLDNTRENFRMLTEALKAGDCKSIATYAHAVKGAGRNLSTVTLADIAYRMERAGYDADIEKATLLYNDLKVEIDRVLTFLSQPDWMDKVAD